MDVFYSVLIYLGTFFLSYSFFKIAERSRMYTRNYYIAIFFALAIPAFIAGARGINVGTDTKGYAYNVFTLCCNTKGLNPIVVYEELYTIHTPIEFLYVVMQFAISRVTTNFFWSLFVVSYSSLFLVYKAVKNISKHINLNISYTMLSFLLFFFNESLNLMRQTLGFSIAIFAFSEFINKKYKKSCILLVIAVLFHRMAILTLSMPILYLVLGKIKNKKKFYFAILIISVVILASFKQLVLGMVDIGLLAAHYSGYVESGYIRLYLNGLIIRLPLLLLLLKKYDKYINKDILSETFFSLFLIELVLINTIYLSPFASRIYGYFLYTKIFLIGKIQCSRSDSIALNWVIPKYNLYLLLYSFVWWAYYTVYLGINDTIPYYFSFFN